MESDHGLISLFEHDLFGKPVSAFPDHALAGAVFLAKSRRDRYQVRAFSGRFSERATWFAAIAQLVEHVIRNDGVTGSSPVCGTSPRS
jgi:hypothetical protein